MPLQDIINTQISDANGYADMAVSAANGLITLLEKAVSNIDSNTRLGYHTTAVPSLPEFGVPEGKPSEWSIELEKVENIIRTDTNPPEDPNLDPVPTAPTLEFVDAGDAPELEFPDIPEALTTSPPDAPQFDARVFPTEPDYTLPTAPTLTTVTVPSVPEFSAIPTFTGTLPTDIVAPEIPTLSFTEEAYTSALTTAAEAWLADIIANGGTGLDASVEQAIFDRSLTREVEAARRNLENALDEFAPGFSKPSGSLDRKVMALRAELQDRTDDLNRKIAEDQARLAQDNTQFALSETLKHEAVLLQHHNAVADRALRLAQALVDVAVAVYEVKVAEYNARLESFKAQAQVFSDLVQAAALEIEHFRAELDVTKAQVEVDSALVERYQSEIDAVKALWSFYNLQVESVRMKADSDMLELQAFRAEVDAYATEARVKELEFAAYRAGVAGEQAKTDAYRAEVDSIRNANENKRAVIDAHYSEVEGVLAANREKLELVNAQTALYRTQIEQNAEVMRTAANAYTAQSDAYRTNIQFEAEKAKIEQGNAEIALENAKGNAVQINETFRLQGKILSDQINAAIAGAASGVESPSARAAAALSQINTVSQIVSSEDVTA